MKYLLLLCLFTLLPALHSAPPTPPKSPQPLEQVNTELLAKAALLADPLTGEVLYARDIDTPYPPASTVKLMTALVAYRKTGGQGTGHNHLGRCAGRTQHSATSSWGDRSPQRTFSFHHYRIG